MTTQEKSIDQQIKEIEEQLNTRKKEHKEEKTIDEQIKEIEEQLNARKKDHKEQISLPKTKEEKDSCLDTFHKEEKVLLAKIEAKSTIIYYLTLELDSAKQQKENLEKQLEVLRDCIIRTASDN